MTRLKYLKLSILTSLTLLLFASPLVFYPYVTTFSMTKETITELAALLVAALWLIWIALREKVEFNYKLTVPIAVFMAALFLSLINTGSFYRSALSLGVWMTYILTFFVITTVFDSRDYIKILLGTVLFAAFLASVYLISQFYGLDFPFWAQQAGRKRLYSTFGNPNYVASYLIGCIPIAFSWYLSMDEKPPKLALGVLTSVLYTTVIMTYTRSSWGGLFLGAVFIAAVSLFYLKKKVFYNNKYWLAGLFIVLLLVSVIYSTPNPINYGKRSAVGRATSTLTDSTPLGKRPLIWLSTIQIAKDHPIIGAGVGTLGLNYPQAQGEVLSNESNEGLVSMANRSINAHNDFLQMWAEIGLFGVLALIGVLATFYWKGVSYLRLSSGNLETKLFAIGLMGGVLALLGHSLFSFPFQIVPNGLLIWVFLASLVVITRSPSDDKTANRETEKDNELISYDDFDWNYGMKWLLVGLTILALGWVGYERVGVFRAGAYLHKAQMNLERDRPELSEKMSREAANINPQEGEIYATMGKALLLQGEYSDAIDVLNRARKNYIYQRLYTHLGYANLKLGQLERAERYLKKNIKYFPNFPNSYVQLARTYNIKGKNELESGNLDESERFLDLAAINQLQAKEFGSEFNFPGDLEDNYYKLGLGLAKKGTKEFRVRNFSFHRTGRLGVTYLLPSKLRPHEPGLLKLFFQSKHGDNLEGTMKILRVQGSDSKEIRETKFDREGELTGAASMLSLLLKEGLPAGNYYLKTRLAYSEKRKVYTEDLFTVSPQEESKLVINKLIMPDIKPGGEDQKIGITVDNNSNGPIKVESFLEVKKTSGEVMLRSEIPRVEVPPGGHNIEYSYPGENLKYFDSGKYEAEIILRYNGGEQRARAPFALEVES